MLETPKQAMIATSVLSYCSFFLIILVIVIDARKKFMSTRKFYYIVIPLILLPNVIIGTYTFWPGSTVNFGIRLLAAIGILIFAGLPIYLFTIPLIESRILKTKKFSKRNDVER